MLERRYHSLTGGRPFPKTTSALKEVTAAPGSGGGGPERLQSMVWHLPHGWLSAGHLLNWKDLKRKALETDIQPSTTSSLSVALRTSPFWVAGYM